MVTIFPFSTTQREFLFRTLFPRDFIPRMKKSLDEGDLKHWIPEFEKTAAGALKSSPFYSISGAREAFNHVFSWVKEANDSGGMNFFPVGIEFLGDVEGDVIRFGRKVGLNSLSLDSRVFTTQKIPLRSEYVDVYLRYTLAASWKIGAQLFRHPGGVLYFVFHPRL